MRSEFKERDLFGNLFYVIEYEYMCEYNYGKCINVNVCIGFVK